MGSGQNVMNVDAAWDWTVRNFPFAGYIRPDRKRGYCHLVRKALETLPQGGRILDFGAGPGDKTAMFAKCGFEVTACDDLLDPWHRIPENRERILGFAEAAGIDYVMGDAETGTFEIPDGPFDMVMMHHVLEHLHDSPRSLLNTLIERVRPGGYLYVTVPNAVNLRKRLAVLRGETNYPTYAAYYWYPGPFRGHVREYVHDDLKYMASYLGLEQVELSSYFHFWHAVPKLARPFVEVASMIVSGFRDSWMLIARKPETWQPRGDLTGGELAAALGRGEYFDYSKFEATR